MKKILTSLALMLFVSTIYAQDGEPDTKMPHQEKRFSIATQPFYWFNCAFRFDFEMRIKDTPSWLQISPIIYVVPENSGSSLLYPSGNWEMMSGDKLNSLFGAGVEANYKYFFTKKESFYVAGGVSYVHHNVKYNDDYWISYIEDGLRYHTPERGELKQNINRLGLQTYLGYQIPNRKHFLFDMFVGLGYRKSFRSDSEGRYFNTDFISIGYTGVVFMSGIRLGFKFK